MARQLVRAEVAVRPQHEATGLHDRGVGAADPERQQAAAYREQK